MHEMAINDNGESLLDDCEVVDLLVAVDVVEDAAQVLLAGVGVHSPAQLGEGSLGHGQVAAADFLGLDADVLPAGVLVVAEAGEALGHYDDGVSLDDEPLGAVLGGGVEELGVVLVGDAGGAVVDDLHLVEDGGVLDVDVGNGGESASETDAGDVDLLEVGLLADGAEVAEDVVVDGLPHLLVGLLDLAVAADVGVDHLVGVEHVLPDVEERVGVAEGEHDEGGVHAEHALHVLLLLLDVVGVQGAVLGQADVAVPVDQVLHVVSADDHRVGQQHLLDVGQRRAEAEQQQASEGYFHVKRELLWQ